MTLAVSKMKENEEKKKIWLDDISKSCAVIRMVRRTVMVVVCNLSSWFPCISSPPYSVPFPDIVRYCLRYGDGDVAVVLPVQVD
jgi:hypothetical protein